MRIAQVAPLYESVPPSAYGGTERVVSYLTEELVRRGHAVTLFASGDSRTAARLVAPCPRALRLDRDCRDPLVYHMLLLEAVAAEARAFDIIHYHCDYLHFPVTRRLGVPSVTTLHGRLDLPDLAPLYRQYRDLPLVSISANQRCPLPWARWAGTVYHGLPRDLYGLQERPGRYLAMLGRISPEKGVDLAIEIARRAGLPLRIAAKVDAVDRAYFERVVRPLFGPDVEFMGEIGDHEKQAFLGDAAVLLFPVNWPEPFGLVLIEAMACGTPVVAFRRGSVPEVVDPGVTGFVVDGVDEAVEAVRRARTLDRRHCRDVFERRFTAARMADAYVAIYRRLIGAGARPRVPAEAAAVRPDEPERVA